MVNRNEGVRNVKNGKLEMRYQLWSSILILLVAGCVAVASAAETSTPVAIDGIEFQVAKGWTLRRVAAEPLVRYPVHADLAPDGRLFVVESSGSSAPVKQQQEERPHRLVVLEDSSGDGDYDRRTVFAEGLMLPQGVLWTEDGVLVATPPEIWQFRDTNGDGVADERSVWFDGKTLTGCANDLHGPFAGRDGWIYWCKGAFAEQQYSRADGSNWSTRASHVFRRRGQSGVIESVMTGGMDNPVEFAMSLCGERFFTCTFIQHPADGQRDALVHAVYGGLYGKEHGVLEGHARTGELMPVMTHLGPAAPAGLAVRESVPANDQSLGELAVAQFNLQKVSLHQMLEQGAGVRTIDTDLLVADRPDFHPTDVLEDADGSLLVIDTGGWYTLCCPTSHIDQSRATGGIYRLTPPGAVPDDPRGTAIAWDTLDADTLAQLLGDARPAVRAAARQRLLADPDAAASALSDALASQKNSAAEPSQLSVAGRIHATWCLIDLIGRCQPAEAARLSSRLLGVIDDSNKTVRLAAIQGVGTYRYQPAVDRLLERLTRGEPRERRYAAEALGRIGDRAAVEPLLAMIPQSADDRVLEHALVYALIEIGDDAVPELIRSLADEDPARRVAALRILDQMDGSPLRAEAVLTILQQGDPVERDLAVEILARRPAWDAAVAGRLGEILDQARDADDPQRWQPTIQRLVLRPGLADAVAEIMGATVDSPADTQTEPQRTQLLDAVAASPPATLPESWIAAIAVRLTSIAGNHDGDDANHHEELERWAKVLAAVRWKEKEEAPKPLVHAVSAAISSARSSEDHWLMLVAAAPPGVQWREVATESHDLSPAFERLVALLGTDSPPRQRQLALAALGRQQLTKAELRRLAETAGELGPMELAGSLALLRRVHDESVNLSLIQSLQRSKQNETLSGSLLEDHFREHPEPIRNAAQPLIQRLGGDRLAQQQVHLRQLLDDMPQGDPLRGLQLFRSSKAACSACHAVGYHGGRIGPDLTRINRIRTAQDLLEAIVYPSASFVRSYESFLVMTDDGRAVNGMIANEDLDSITLITGIDQRVRIPRDEIELIRPSEVSIMPAGLDQQLTLQELADLLAFLKSER